MTNPIALLGVGLVIVQVTLLSTQAQAQAVATKRSPLAFAAAGTNGFTFDTGVLRGRLRADGRSKGLSSVEHIATGIRLDRSMGLFGHYRLFTADKRYGGGAWDWPSDATLRPDGSVEARWPATGERPFDLRAIYRWASPATLDLETIVQAKTNLAKFESFLASYFAGNFTNSLAYVAKPPGKPEVAGFMAAEPGAGLWQAFPRDEAAAAIFHDGRWTIPPNPVDWVQMPRLARPLGIRRDPVVGLAAVIMSPPADAFAVCTPHQTEGHYPMYLSLFGCDLKAGETARARARLLIVEKLSYADAVKAYEHYLQELGGK